VLLGLLFLVVFGGFVSAQAAYEDEINKAMSCLDDKVDSASLTLDQAVFAAWAGVPNDKISKKINDSKSSSLECWPSGSCSVKDTAQVILAKKKLGEDTAGAEDWLLNQSGTATGLIWFLQITIDNNGPASCTISYDGNSHNVNVNDDMTLSSGAGSCLSLANADYWLQMSDSCVEKTFEISCSNSAQAQFKTNLLYRKESGGTVYISPDTNVGDSGTTTEEKISAKCFKGTDGSCDYESTLWASTALKGNQGEDYAPYLRVVADENRKYFPSAFLMHILGDENYALDIYGLRQQSHWEIVGSPYSKYYNTALAMMALGAGRGNADAPELADTLTYLIGANSGRGADGCWGSLKDTAFIIYSAGWLRSGGGGDDCTSNSDCSSGYICADGTCVAEDGPTPIPPISGEPNTCVDGYWIDEDEAVHDTKVDEGYCHLEEGGCCVDGYECEIPDDDENKSICVEKSDGGGGYDPDDVTDCEAALYYCVPNNIACIDALGNVLDDNLYSCTNPYEVCCDTDARPQLEACHGRGELCLEDEECSTPEVQSSDGPCCTGTCEIEDVPGPGPSDECVVDADCDDGEVCESGDCVGGGGSMWLWIIILLILIILVALGIIYRNKLRVMFFKMRGKAKSSKVSPKGGPPMGLRPRPVMGRRPPTFGGRPTAARRPTARPAATRAPAKKKAMSAKDKEMEDTLKKLREMSK